MKSKDIQAILNIIYDAGFEDYSLTHIAEDNTLALFSSVGTEPPVLVRKKAFNKKFGKYLFTLNTEVVGHLHNCFEDWKNLTIPNFQHFVNQYNSIKEE